MKREIIFDLYPIVSGCSTPCIFEGNETECQKFVSDKRLTDPCFDFILLPYEY